DQAEEDPEDRGRALVSSPDGWRVEMARWISAAREAAAEQEAEGSGTDEDQEEEDVPMDRVQRLFGTGVKESLRTHVSRRAQEEEEAYMRVMAELDEQDDVLDDGGIEIDDDEVWGE
ncbi:hypothetical protein DFH07DRAFT_785811, partial [Mycena maculata]